MNNIFMLRLAQRICTDYRHFGIYLGLETYTIDEIAADNSKVVDRAFLVVQTWKYTYRKPGSVTAYKTLSGALSELKREDLVDFVRSGE